MHKPLCVSILCYYSLTRWKDLILTSQLDWYSATRLVYYASHLLPFPSFYLPLPILPPLSPVCRQVGKQDLSAPSHVVERYIELLCRYQPQDVYGFLHNNDNYRVEEALDVR